VFFFVVFCAHIDCICSTSFVDRTLDDENRDLYGNHHFMNSSTMQGRKKTNKKSTQNVVDGRTLGHQSNRRSIRNARKPHRHVMEEGGSSTLVALNECDIFNSSNYNSKGEES
jgi:hypothetical protein